MFLLCLVKFQVSSHSLETYRLGGLETLNLPKGMNVLSVIVTSLLWTCELIWPLDMG